MSDRNSPDATAALAELEEEVSRFGRERHLTVGPALRLILADLYLAATQHAAQEAAAAALPDDFEPDSLTKAQRAHYTGLIGHADALHRWVDRCRAALALEDANPAVQRINRSLDGML